MAKGYCDKHYRQFRRTGDPLKHADRNETNKKISNSLTDKPKSQKHKDSLSKSALESYANGRINPRKGVKLPQEQKDEQSKKMKGRSSGFKGHKQPESAKQTLREKATGRKDSEETKQKKKDAHNTPKALEESRRIGLETNADPIKKARQIAGLKATYGTPKGSQIQFERQKLATANRIPKSTEEPVIKILRDAGIRFKHQKHVHIADHKKYGLRPTKKIDFFIRPNKIIETNGTYDHADNRVYSPDDLIRSHSKKVPAKEIWEKEELTLNQIRKNNFKILVVWEYDLQKNLKETTTKILKFTKS